MSEYQQTYSHRHHYTSADAITIPIVLSSAPTTYIDLVGKLDTGSTFCIFERAFADMLNLELMNGTRQRFATATGSFYAYGHMLTLSVFSYEWEAMIYFAESESFSLNILGRIGFLDHIRLGIVDYEQLLFCGLYDEP